MTLEEKAGQLFIFTFTSRAQALHDLRLHPGGFIRIYSDALTVARDNAAVCGRTRVPLIIAADFEKGVGPTVGGGTQMVTNMCLGAAGDEAMAASVARVIAAEARAIGVNMNYVPVLDVNCNADNPIINTRSFGGDPALVARLGTAFVRGTRAGGCLACAKHFPGHGDTTTDSHSDLGTVAGDRKRLDAVELLPFRAAIDAGIDAIMSAPPHGARLRTRAPAGHAIAPHHAQPASRRTRLPRRGRERRPGHGGYPPQLP